MTSRFLLTAPFPSINLKFVSSLERPIGGFRGFYNISNCGGIIDGSHAEITSPGYPDGYPAGIVCEWLLLVPQGEVIQLTVQDLRLEEDCTKDYVTIRSGKHIRGPAIATICGTHSVPSIMSSSDSLSVIFHSDMVGSAPGFRIITSDVQRGCGGSIYSNFGNFSSPNYPSRYDNNIECVWTIQYSPGSVVKIEFSGRFDLEMDDSCSKDYLQFEEMGDDGRWVVGEKKCGSSTPSSYLSKSNKLRLTFHSNDRIVGDGFNLTYNSECGGNFTGLKGNVMSPNYPNFYSDRLNCTYVIGKSGDYISLKFDDPFSIEGEEACFYDYVEIYQKNDKESNKQGRYCGDITPAPRTLLGPVTVKFISDGVYTAHGFNLHYEILNCGAVFTGPSGVISTPTATGEYINNMDCTWHIITVGSHVIQLRFRHFDLEDSYGCWKDNLEIFDGNSTLSPSIGRFCGKGVSSVKSTGSEVTLRFRTNHRMTSRGFSISYITTYGESQGCGGTLNATSGEIRSLDATHDGRYEPSLDCPWMILANEPDQIVNLEFETFDLQAPSNSTCEFDFLEIREYSSDGAVIGRYCGNRKPDPIMTSASAVFVHFHTDSFISASGFRLRYTISPSPCGPSSLQTGPEAKTLTSPGYPNAYPKNIRCKWTIERPYNSSLFSAIALSVTSLDIPCGGDFLEVKKMRGMVASRGPSGSRSLYPLLDSDLIRTCGTTPPQILNFRGSIEVTFSSDPVDNGGNGFSLTYKDASCNSTYADGNGIITNGYYPMRFNPSTTCPIYITVPAGRTVSVYFRQFDVMYTANCEAGYMKIHDGVDASSPLVATYCGQSIPNPVFSTGRSLFLDVNLPSRIGLYFLTYTSTDQGRGCGGELHATEGSFSSPLYPAAYNRAGQCKWHITVPGYHNVKLQFTSFALNSTAGCDVNYMEVYEGSTDDISKRVARYCGSDQPGDHELRSNEAVVKLVTDATNNRPGFYANFEADAFVVETIPVGVVQRYNLPEV